MDDFADAILTVHEANRKQQMWEYFFTRFKEVDASGRHSMRLAGDFRTFPSLVTQIERLGFRVTYETGFTCFNWQGVF
ncbi:hypothetical protein [Lacticaseibacillus saniviri]|uniref:Uncharacterized protein n=1 Tax=Lacticaseibacillus saniviri JCM 17471 = DSM 24301 TaxID=1293598 RepID=A0A0R2MRG4_9LACO|nr:hypothetical protein [Lacticaseibacillus saniviri]KRO16183.1 hypothetical protein IV56_GL001899 [Lacticaseibacillus saniviri JCM 17471 = DSM 24301]